MSSPVLSVRSGRVRSARRLVRRADRAEHRLFLAEGPQAVREALAVAGCVREVFASPGRHEDLRRTAAEASPPVVWHLLDDAALASIADTVHPQGVVAVCRTVDVPLATLLATAPDLLAVCADVRDPGNAGAVIRCADAAGAGGVVVTGDSVDVHNGKVVRATAGSLFHLPLVAERDAAATVAAIRAAGLTVLAADGAGDTSLDDAADGGLLAGRSAWLFGNEAWGIPDHLSSLAEHRVRIPIHGRAESLNLATAAALCLYASARAQRRPKCQRRPT